MDRRYFVVAPLGPDEAYWMAMALEKEESGDHELAEEWLNEAIYYEEWRKNLYLYASSAEATERRARGGMWRIR